MIGGAAAGGLLVDGSAPDAEVGAGGTVTSRAGVGMRAEAVGVVPLSREATTTPPTSARTMAASSRAMPTARVEGSLDPDRGLLMAPLPLYA